MSRSLRQRRSFFQTSIVAAPAEIRLNDLIGHGLHPSAGLRSCATPDNRPGWLVLERGLRLARRQKGETSRAAGPLGTDQRTTLPSCPENAPTEGGPAVV